MPKYPGISPYDNEKGTLGTAKKRWEKLYVKEIESDTVSGMEAQIENLATTAENSVSAAVSAKNDAVAAKTAAQAAQTAAETAAAGIQSVVETDVDNTLSIAGVAADAKVTGDWLRDIAKPVTLDTSLPETAYADEFMKVTTDSEGRVLYGVKRDGTFTWQKGVPKHLQDKINELAAPTIDNDEYMYVMLDSEGHVLFGVKKDGSFDWQKGLPKPVREVAQTVIDSEEFVQLTQDADGKLIEGIKEDGSKVFFSPVRFAGGARFTQEDVANILRGLNQNSKLLFDYAEYVPQNIIGGLTTGIDVLYLDGDMDGISKENKVNLSYKFRGISGTCTLKWQGATSINFPKKNYTIAKMTPAIDVGWGSQKKYCLKGDFADYSRARNIISAKLWGEMVKNRTPENARLKVLPNGGAIDGFPVMLVINNEYHGLYNFNIPKDKWMLDMGEGTYEAMITAEEVSPTTAFRATVSKEDMLAAKYWELEYIPDEANPDWAIDSLNRMISAVITSTGANYRNTLEDYLDIESAIDYFIHCCILGNMDGSARNFIMCTYDGVKWFFNAYDLDWTFGSYRWGTLYRPPSAMTVREASETNRVFHLIYRYDTAALKARYSQLRNSVLSEANVYTKVTNFLTPVSKALIDEEVKRWPTTPGTIINNWEQMVEWYRQRCKFIDDEINAL